MNGSLVTNDQQGFTLIEILVALTIFAFGLLGIAALQGRAINFNANSNTRTVTSAMAQSVMEEILAMPSNTPAFKDGLTFPTDRGTTTLPDGRTFSAQWGVEKDTPAVWVSKIKVVVTGPQNRTVTLTNYKRYTE